MVVLKSLEMISGMILNRSQPKLQPNQLPMKCDFLKATPLSIPKVDNSVLGKVVAPGQWKVLLQQAHDPGFHTV